MAEISKPICQLGLDATETLIIFDSLKLMNKQIWGSDQNVPLDISFKVNDLLRTIYPAAMDAMAIQQQAALQVQQGEPVPPSVPDESVPANPETPPDQEIVH